MALSIKRKIYRIKGFYKVLVAYEYLHFALAFPNSFMIGLPMITWRQTVEHEQDQDEGQTVLEHKLRKSRSIKVRHHLFVQVIRFDPLVPVKTTALLLPVE